MVEKTENRLLGEVQEISKQRRIIRMEVNNENGIRI